MKDILDTIILIMFVIMVAMFIINFNRQQITKYTDKLWRKWKINNSTKEKQMNKPLLIEIGVEELPAIPFLNELPNIEKMAVDIRKNRLLCDFDFFIHQED